MTTTLTTPERPRAFNRRVSTRLSQWGFRCEYAEDAYGADVVTVERTGNLFVFRAGRKDWEAEVNGVAAVWAAAPKRTNDSPESVAFCISEAVQTGLV